MKATKKSQRDQKIHKETEELYRTLGLQSEEVRHYLVGLGTMGTQEQNPRRMLFIEAGASSLSSGSYSDA